MPQSPTRNVSTLRKLGRALLLRCPRCGGSGVLRTWFALRTRCPRCNLTLERGESHEYWLGGYAINMVVAESLAGIIALVVLLRTWPATRAAMATGITLAIALPILFFPFSRLLWLAVDLSFRPRLPGDE